MSGAPEEPNAISRVAAIRVKKFYDALVESGFNEVQAFDLVELCAPQTPEEFGGLVRSIRSAYAALIAESFSPDQAMRLVRVWVLGVLSQMSGGAER